MVKNSIKGDKSKFREFTCYVYGSFFSWNHQLTWPCSLCRILLIARAISLKFWYVVAETWLYVAYGLRFLKRCREHSIWSQIFKKMSGTWAKFWFKSEIATEFDVTCCRYGQIVAQLVNPRAHDRTDRVRVPGGYIYFFFTFFFFYLIHWLRKK